MPSKLISLPLDKLYECYEEAVQDTRAEVTNLLTFYRSANADRSVPLILREDFCGTAALCRQWCLQTGVESKAIGVDWDPQVLSYAQSVISDRHARLEDRIRLHCANVLVIENVEQADILVAFNYAVSFMHTRSQLLAYLRQARLGVRPGGGIFVCDLFGGSSCHGNQTQRYRKEYGSFQYIFEQAPLNPVTQITHTVQFAFRISQRHPRLSPVLFLLLSPLEHCRRVGDVRGGWFYQDSIVGFPHDRYC